MRHAPRVFGPMLVCAAALMLLACGDSDDGNTNTNLDTLFGDAVGSDVNNPPNDTGTPAVKKLEFKTDFGDDQAACRGTARCTVFISFTEQRSLEVAYTEDGVASSGQTVKFALENDNDGVGFLTALSSVTDASGIGTVQTKAKVAQVGQFSVKAWIDSADNLPPLYFDVVVTPKGQVPLTVVATYSGTRPVGAYGVQIYKQDAAKKPDCTNPQDLLDNQTANLVRDNVLLTQSAKFPQIDGLETDMTQTYTILAFSRNENNAIQAWACDDVKGVLTWGQSVTVQLELMDRPPQYLGAYDLRNFFDLISAIPDPYGQWVDYVVSFFQDPTGTILELACDLLTPDDQQAAGQLNSFCDLLFDVDGNGDLQPTAIHGFAADLLNAVITSLAQNSTFGQILQAGGDVADILKAFEFKSTIELQAEPDADGKWTAAQTSESWHTVVVKWTLGQNCNAVTDEGCGVQQFGTSAFQAGGITGNFTASVANDFDLTIDAHELSIKYGALLDRVLQTIAIPLITGEPTVDSYQDLLGFLIGGNVECLTATEGLDCCGRFADGIGDENMMINGGTETAIRAACNVISTTGPGFLSNALTGLDLDSGNGFQIGTLTPCKLADPDNDLVIESIGSQATPCKWNVKVGDNGQFFEAQFFGSRAGE